MVVVDAACHADRGKSAVSFHAAASKVDQPFADRNLPAAGETANMYQMLVNVAV
jgi:hypothetical protein